MLPFLKNARRQVAGMTMEVRKPDEPEKAQDDPEAGLRAAAMDLIKAVNAQDEHGVMSALRAAFQIMESQPHDEAPESQE